MRVVLTGAAGFLGWHTRLRLVAGGVHQVVPVGRDNWDQLSELVAEADAVVHVAGVNRGPEREVEEGNLTLAHDVAHSLSGARSVTRVVFANSIQAGNDTAYGRGKAAASRVLAAAAEEHGARFVDVGLPNLFGEHGRPYYNSFVQTFVAAVCAGQAPDVVDRPIALLHVQDAAQALIDALDTTGDRVVAPAGTATTVAQILATLQSFFAVYRNGEIPPLLTDLDVDLFNTLRAALFPHHYPIPLPPRSDHRGALVEVVRCHGGTGQTFVSTTRTGVTRGEHFHLRKVERFVVLSGQASIRLRRLFTEEVVTFEVDGERPCVVDMPTGWAHNITNTGDTELTTLFWTNELFDPERPDTYPEPVGGRALAPAGRP